MNKKFSGDIDANCFSSERDTLKNSHYKTSQFNLPYFKNTIAVIHSFQASSNRANLSSENLSLISP
ncbi:MAG: hypothetical protein ACJAZP_000061 [Psychromonas sp.]|jgi:hypothetical protein